MEENNITNWYFIGVLTAFLIGLFKVIISLNIQFSVKANNFKKVNCYYHYFSGSFLPEKPSRFSFPFFLIYLLILAPIFSWLSVLSAVWGYLHALTNKVEMPERLKEIIFKLSTVNLPKEKVIELQKEWSQSIGVNLPVYTGKLSEDGEMIDNNDDSDLNTLDLGSDEDTSIELELDPVGRTYDIWHRFDLGRGNSVYEYKFVDGKILERLLEKESEHAGSPERIDVKDNVVMESEIQKRPKIGLPSFDDVEEKVKELKQETEWHEIMNFKIKFFIMSRHPEVFSPLEYRKSIRSDLERIQVGCSKVKHFAESIGFEIREDKEFGGQNIVFPENCDENKRKEMDLQLSKELSERKFVNFGISVDEFSNSKEHIVEFKKLLGEA